MGRQLGQWYLSHRFRQLLSDIEPIELSTSRSSALWCHGNQEGGGARRGEGRTVPNSHRFSHLQTHESYSQHYHHLTAAWWECSSSAIQTTTLSYLYTHSPTHTHSPVHKNTLQDVPAVSLATGLVCAASIRMQPWHGECVSGRYMTWSCVNLWTRNCVCMWEREDSVLLFVSVICFTALFTPFSCGFSSSIAVFFLFCWDKCNRTDHW